MIDEPKLSADAAKAIVAEKTAPKVTEESIRDKIANVEYSIHTHATVCLITMNNGFIVTGLSAPASPENFDPDVGKRFAYDAAFRQLWPLEGYLLRENLYEYERLKTADDLLISQEADTPKPDPVTTYRNESGVAPSEAAPDATYPGTTTTPAQETPPDGQKV